MAGDQLSTIRALVLDRYAGSSSDPLFDPAIVDRMINVSNKRLGRVADWPWLHVIGTISQTANLSSYTLTGLTNFRHIKYVAVGNDKLTYKYPQAFVAVNTLTGTTPSFYTVIGDTLKWSPIPSQANTIDIVYVVDENDLQTDSDRPLLPTGYTELLVLATLPALAMRKGDSEYYNLAKQEYKSSLQEALDEVRRTRQNPTIEVDQGLWTTM